MKEKVKQACTLDLQSLESQFNSSVSIQHRGKRLPFNIVNDCIDFIHQYHIDNKYINCSIKPSFTSAVFLHLAQQARFPLHEQEVKKQIKCEKKYLRNDVKKINCYVESKNNTGSDKLSKLDMLSERVLAWIYMCKTSRNERGKLRIQPELDPQEMSVIHLQLESMIEQLRQHPQHALWTRDACTLAAAIICKACIYKRGNRYITNNTMAQIVGVSATTVTAAADLLIECKRS
jgi:hypothetical protein